jgi:DNA-binding transcriptional regulator YdaS (Cro superfamily)
MESRTLYADTLRIAADTLGGSRNLARRLGVSPDELELWMSGRKCAPLEPFLTALEIIEI